MLFVREIYVYHISLKVTASLGVAMILPITVRPLIQTTAGWIELRVLV